MTDLQDKNSNRDEDDKLFIHDRWSKILRYISPDSVTSIESLSDSLNVSHATIRRDLNKLDEIQQLKRVRGGAIALNHTQKEFHSLLGQAIHTQSYDSNAIAKKAIGLKAASLLEDGEAIIIDGGTTTVHFANSINTINLNILTTSISIMNALFGKKNIRIMITGGEVFEEQKVILNPYGDSIINKFSASKIFIGAQAITEKGLLQTDPLLVHYEQDLIARAEEVIVLADSTKFESRGSLVVCELDVIDKIITDENITNNTLEMLKHHKIDVITVPIVK
jgi:DeoR family ulaG and ulaABCDEF operon transcriptional repressor